MNSRLVIAAIEADGWTRVGQKGSHVQFKHPGKPGRVSVPHPKGELPIGTIRSIGKQSRPEAEVIAMRHYIALIHKEENSDYGVSFPDFPGCITLGADLDEARAWAEEVLAFHAEGMAADGSPIPEPSGLEQVMADRENRDGVAILVPLKVAGARTVRVDVTIPEDVLDRIDRYAAERGMNRSGFLTLAARRTMEADGETAAA